MLDIQIIRERLEEVKTAAKNKNIDLDLDRLIKLDDKRKELQNQIDDLRAKRNEHAKSITGKPTDEQIKEGKDIKNAVVGKEGELAEFMDEYTALMVQVPTITASDVPVGKDESENVEIERHGNPRKFDFKPKDHIALGKELDIIDFERGVKVSGYRGYYMKNEGASLQMALMMYALEKLIGKGFTPVIPPTLVREFVLFGSGYFAGQAFDEDVDEIYKIANNKEVESDGQVNKDPKFLIGTAEPSLLAYYANEVLDEKDLPIKFCGFSPCYRSEIGSYGKDTKGLYRVHEFMKVEQVCITTADIEKSEKLHQEMLGISKEMHEEIGLPYRVLQICTGDMSAGKYKMFDMEAWIPSREGYGETGSASNFLDWQARRLNVRYKKESGEKSVAFMLNNTAIPSPRFIISILENFQNEDGTVTIPEVLRKFMPGNVGVIKKK
ncbi:MAG: serine--tRNA ligase [Candidatus Pacebacteria bacterium]|nr:serine--tRNA ligase [Candidatus Paceibacterota bacterium]